MKTIWKFPLRVTTQQTIEMPAGAKVLSTSFQGDTLVVWAEVNPNAWRVGQPFEVYGTGESMPPSVSRKFVGTAFLGSFVFHVYLV